MVKYVDVDKSLSRLPDDLPYKASVKRVLIQAPAADVIPISAIEKIISATDKVISEVKVEIAKEIFDEIKKCLNIMTPNSKKSLKS